MKHSRAKATNQSARQGPPASTQALLVEYRAVAEAARRKDAMRRQILGLVAAGAPLEIGRLLPEVVSVARAVPTWAKLEALLGAEDAAWVRGRIERTECQFLKIVERWGGMIIG